jgi:hypothetical protein
LEALVRDLVVFLVSKGFMTNSDKVGSREARHSETFSKSLRSSLVEVVSEEDKEVNKQHLSAEKTLC